MQRGGGGEGRTGEADEQTKLAPATRENFASGIYGYRADFLPTIVKLPKSEAAAKASAAAGRSIGSSGWLSGSIGYIGSFWSSGGVVHKVGSVCVWMLRMTHTSNAGFLKHILQLAQKKIKPAACIKFAIKT